MITAMIGCFIVWILLPPVSAPAAGLENQVYVQMQHAPMDQVFMHLQQAGGLKFVLGEGITGEADLNVSGETVKQILDRICGERGWIWYPLDTRTIAVDQKPTPLTQEEFEKLLDNPLPHLVIPGGPPGKVFKAMAEQVGLPIEADERLLNSRTVIPPATLEQVTIAKVCELFSKRYGWDWFPLRQYEGILFRPHSTYQSVAPTATPVRKPALVPKPTKTIRPTPAPRPAEPDAPAPPPDAWSGKRAKK